MLATNPRLPIGFTRCVWRNNTNGSSKKKKRCNAVRGMHDVMPTEYAIKVCLIIQSFQSNLIGIVRNS